MNTIEYYAKYYEDSIRRIKESYKRKSAIEKYTQLVNNEIKLITEISEVTRVTVKVEWAKSYTWGMNPTAEIWVGTKEYHSDVECYSKGKASGCGYDKESASVACALNQLLPIKKLLMDNWIYGDKECLGYGVSSYNNRVPYFDGGVGMDCFVRAFNEMGFECIQMHSKTFDGYEFRKVEK